MKHRHHILPRHQGGSDDPTNIIELSIEEHAEAHRLLYEQNGHEEDRIAWLALSGQITSAQARVLAVQGALTGKPKSAYHRRKISVSLQGRPGRKHTPEAREKMRLAKLGKPRAHNEKTTAAIRAACIGKPRSEETKRKISDTMKRKYRHEDDAVPTEEIGPGARLDGIEEEPATGTT